MGCGPTDRLPCRGSWIRCKALPRLALAVRVARHLAVWALAQQIGQSLSGEGSDLRLECERWLAAHEWTSTPDAHSNINYEIFQRCLSYLHSGNPAPEEHAARQVVVAGIHHPMLLSVHRGTMPYFALSGLQRFEACRKGAELSEGVDVMHCCNGGLSCWGGGELAAECCRVLSNTAGDDPPLALLAPALDVHLGSRLRSQKTFNV